MPWTIEIDYTTGGSFSSERGTDEVGMAWSSLDDAKVALKYIKEHYEAYEAIESCSYRNRPNHKEWDHYRNKPWYYDDYPSGSIVVTSNGSVSRMSVFWTGYFETLHGARIIGVDVDNDMWFEL